ncbi:MAG: VOC family protein [Jatrophihabitans sp.]|uniref:VOC family protein n=1 Tax=Jatrophihabitans sp. TaxID=1932789 RepID=UPI00390DE6B1
MPDRPALDHLVLAAPDLDQAVAWFADITGVRPAPGGSHIGLGTANHLVGLGAGGYLEIIGPDPAQPDPDQPRPFGIDALSRPRLVTWAVCTADLNAAVQRARAAGYDPGDPLPMSRRTPDGHRLAWRLTPPRLDLGDGVVPFLIDWDTTPHPTTRELPLTPLLELSARHPDPAPVAHALAALGVGVRLTAGEPAALTAVVQGRDRPVPL